MPSRIDRPDLWKSGGGRLPSELWRDNDECLLLGVYVYSGKNVRATLQNSARQGDFVFARRSEAEAIIF